MRQVLICIPTLNERENIERLIHTLRALLPHADLLIIDDDSSDGTGVYVEKRATSDSAIHCLRRTGRRGLGSAYREGFLWALNHNYETIIQMDADGSHDPETLPSMLKQAAQYEVIIGSRYIRGGAISNWPFIRRAVSLCGNIYIHLILRARESRYKVYDSTSGFKVWRAGALRRIHPETLTSDGYAFQIETTWRAVTTGCTYKEFPITFQDRTMGSSKILRSNILATFLLPFRLTQNKKG